MDRDAQINIIIMIIISHLGSDDQRCLGDDELSGLQVSGGHQVAAEVWWTANLVETMQWTAFVTKTLTRLTL